MPYWVSKIHCQITVLVSAGIDHASIRPEHRQQPHLRAEPLQQQRDRPFRTPSSARTLTAAEHHGAAQHRPELVVVRGCRGSCRDRPSRLRAPNCCFRPNSCSDSVTSRTIGIAEHQPQREDRRHQQDVGQRPNTPTAGSDAVGVFHVGEFSISRVDDWDHVLRPARRCCRTSDQPLRISSIAASALAASSFTSAPPEMATIMSGRMLLASTAAQFSLDGTKRLFSAALACAVGAFAAADARRAATSGPGSCPGRRTASGSPVETRILQQVVGQFGVLAVGRDGQVRATEERRRRGAGGEARHARRHRCWLPCRGSRRRG